MITIKEKCIFLKILGVHFIFWSQKWIFCMNMSFKSEDIFQNFQKILLFWLKIFFWEKKFLNFFSQKSKCTLWAIKNTHLKIHYNVWVLHKDVTKCPTKMVYFVGHFVGLLRKKIYVNDWKTRRFYLDIGRTFCFLKSDLRIKDKKVCQFLSS